MLKQPTEHRQGLQIVLPIFVGCAYYGHSNCRRVERFIVMGLGLDLAGHLSQVSGWGLLGVALGVADVSDEFDDILKVGQYFDIAMPVVCR